MTIVSHDQLSDCTICGAGKYSVATAATLATICTDCPSGTYMDVGNDGTDATEHDGTNDCKQCEKGKYQDQTGQTSCDVCVAGKYRETPATSTAYDSSNTNNANLNSDVYIGGELNLTLGSDSARYIDAALGNNTLTIRGASGGDANFQNMALFTRNGSVSLNFSGNKKFETIEMFLKNSKLTYYAN